MRQQVTLHAVPKTGVTVSAAEAPGRTVRANVEHKVRVVRTPEGAEVASSAKVILDPENAPKPESFITLDTGTAYARRTKVITASLEQKPRKPDRIIVYTE
jgi:hypothetical protein